jgi:formate hydrogenlyase transcriptional activator
MDKHIDTIPDATMEALLNWHWPGNVRELENSIERSVILTEEGNALYALLAELGGKRTEPRPRISRWRPPSANTLSASYDNAAG